MESETTTEGEVFHWKNFSFSLFVLPVIPLPAGNKPGRIIKFS
jgi:hypothetical protein